jgi:hypothetical protein
MPLRRALLGFGAAALVILAAAPLFAWSAKGIAEISGLGNTFVGTWLVGIATSRPELAVHRRRPEPSSLLMLVAYAAAIWLLYAHTTGGGP